MASAASAAKDPGAIVAALETLAETMSFLRTGEKKLRGVDRKTERATIFAHKKTLEETLDAAVAENDASRAFAAAAPLALVTATGRAVTLTGRSFGSALAAFDSNGCAHGALRDEHVAFLKTRTADTRYPRPLADSKRIPTAPSISMCRQNFQRGFPKVTGFKV